MSNEQALSVYERQLALIKSTGYYDALRDAIAHARNSKDGVPSPKKAISLALRQVAFREDNVWMSTRGATQLAAFSAMLEGFGIARCDAVVYDPYFKERDRTLLRSLGYDAPETAFGTEKEPEMPHLEETTLLWSPGYTPHTLWMQNWGRDDLHKLVEIAGTQCMPQHRIYGEITWINYDGPHEMELMTVSAEISEDFEPHRRAYLLAESLSLPSYDEMQVNSGVKDNSPRHEGYHLSKQVASLFWYPKERLNAMGNHFWKIEPFQVRAGRAEPDDIKHVTIPTETVARGLEIIA